MKTTEDSLAGRIDTKINAILPQSPEATKKRKDRILKPLAYIGIAAGLAGLGYATHRAFESWNNSTPPVPSVVHNHSGLDQDLDNGTIHITVPNPQETNQ